MEGQVEEVIAALEQRQKELGVPEAKESETSPRRVVADTLGVSAEHTRSGCNTTSTVGRACR